MPAQKPASLASRIFRSLGLASLAAMALQSPGVFAASQGAIAATSKGSIGISVSVARQIEVSGLSDVTFADDAALTGARQTQRVCIRSTSLTGGYNVTASGSGPGGEFVLASDAATAPYSVEWAGSSSQQSSAPLVPGVPSGPQTSLARKAGCGTGGSSLTVAMNGGDAIKPGASYTGALDLLIAPM
jgi:hypothetical protein